MFVMLNVIENSDVQGLWGSTPVVCVVGTRQTKEAGVRTCRNEKQGMGTIVSVYLLH